VGDRHLDNLMLTKSGKLFHIDFGYILGRDPKPLPPPMKLSKEMVEAMGGVHSEHYQQFRKLCYTTFLHLRRSGTLLMAVLVHSFHYQPVFITEMEYLGYLMNSALK
jgi:phosphatidylinositol 3-kinase